METKLIKIDWFFLILCLMLGILAEESFFRWRIGISYLVFVVAFYSVFFWHLRRFSLTHQRVGYFILCCIWVLAASYFFNETLLFYLLNILVIPGLVVLHLVLVTSPRNFKWNQPLFFTYLLSKLLEVVKYDARFLALVGTGAKSSVDEDKAVVWKKMGIGVLVALPVLIVVLKLLMTADTHFDRLMGQIPDWFRIVNAETIIRWIIVLFCTIVFFGFMQVLAKKQTTIHKQNMKFAGFQVDVIIAVTVLIIINTVYLLFTIVQFKYFFGGTLQNDYTFAAYARKGFFELLFVTMINFSITIAVLVFVHYTTAFIKRLTQIMLTFLILSSSVMLGSAFLRMSMYEEAYGFTFIRVLVHSFMIFLTVIFAYTLVKIWLEKLSLFHFYFISTILYYTVITVVDLNGIVVKENIHRYEITGKIDIYYFKSMASSGTLGLIEIYEKNQNLPGLKSILSEQKRDLISEKSGWQSFNLKREEAVKRLKAFDIKE